MEVQDALGSMTGQYNNIWIAAAGATLPTEQGGWRAKTTIANASVSGFEMVLECLKHIQTS
jgi:hypothetical protein